MHHITFVFKVFLACMRVDASRSQKMGFLSGFVLLVLYGHGGGLIVSFLMAKPWAFMFSDFQILTNLVLWTLFWYFPKICRLSESLMKNREAFLFIHILNELRRALSMMESVESTPVEMFKGYLDIWPWVQTGIGMTGGGILYPFFCWVLFGESKRCEELYEMSWKCKMVWITSLIYYFAMQTQIQTMYRFQVMSSICVIYVVTQIL